MSINVILIFAANSKHFEIICLKKRYRCPFWIGFFEYAEYDKRFHSLRINGYDSPGKFERARSSVERSQLQFQNILPKKENALKSQPSNKSLSNSTGESDPLIFFENNL